MIPEELIWITFQLSNCIFFSIFCFFLNKIKLTDILSDLVTHLIKFLVDHFCISSLSDTVKTGLYDSIKIDPKPVEYNESIVIFV